MTIKQPKGSGMCAVCVAAMATNTTCDDVYAFLNDGREMGDPILDVEVAMYLLKHAWLMGRGWNIGDAEDEKSFHVRDATRIQLIVDGLVGERAYIAVKSRNYPGVAHAVFWDGYTIMDPDPGVPDKTNIEDYALLQVFPLTWLGWENVPGRLRCEKADLPFFVKRWRTSKERGAKTSDWVRDGLIQQREAAE